jgi:hypothetical protein
MEPNSLSFSITDAQDNFGPGPIYDAFLLTATELMRGATVLTAAPRSESKWAFALVAGQILECSLKAFLAKKTGLPEEELKKKFGHQLSKLWVEAAGQGLQIGNMPQWAETLNSLHEFPYHLRYPTKINALVFPNTHETESGLRSLIDTVRKGIGAL